MKTSLLLCFGSTLAALAGLLALAWGARRQRWFWLLLAASLLVSAGFGAAETVYEFYLERQLDDDTGGSIESSLAARPTPTLWPSQPLATPVQTGGPPVSAVPARPTTEPTFTPLPTATRTALPPTPTKVPATTTPVQTSEPPVSPRPTYTSPAAPLSKEFGALAVSLIAAERAVLYQLDDAPQYALDVLVDMDALTVHGTAEIVYTNRASESLDDLYLRLYPNAEHYKEGETAIDAVNVDGRAADFVVRETILEIPLDAPLAPQSQTTLQIAFHVQVPRRADRFGYAEGVMSLGHWYPMMAVYDDEGWNLDPFVPLGDAFYTETGTFNVRVTVPDEVVVAATGVEVGRILQHAPRTTITFVSGATRDFALALSRDYQTISAQVGETTVTAYYLPDDEPGAQEALQVAADAVEVYNQRFGLYPYTELDVAETALLVEGSPGGMEFPGIVFISSELYDPESWARDELDIVVAHEVAHQWWYAVVGNNQVDDPWLDESFATFSSLVYVQEVQGEAAYQSDFMMQALLPYQWTVALGGDAPIAKSLLDYDDDWASYAGIAYCKGTLFLLQLRDMLGDEIFFAVMQHHFETHRYGLLAPDDFRRSLEAVSGDAEALDFYDAVVVRGEPISDLPGLE